jgi:hypothetical protein
MVPNFDSGHPDSRTADTLTQHDPISPGFALRASFQLT